MDGKSSMLKLRKETIDDLSRSEAELVQGGLLGIIAGFVIGVAVSNSKTPKVCCDSQGDDC